MRLFPVFSAVLIALGGTAAQAQSAYRCSTPNGTVFQDRPCSNGASVRVHKAVPVPAAEPEPQALSQQELQMQILQLQAQQKMLEQERLAEEGAGAPPPRPSAKTGQQNMQDYLDDRDRQREQWRSDQRQAFAAEDARTAPGAALARIDNRLRDLRMRRDSMAATPRERSRAAYQEERLLRLRPRIAAGNPDAMEEAEAYMY